MSGFHGCLELGVSVGVGVRLRDAGRVKWVGASENTRKNYNAAVTAILKYCFSNMAI